MSVEPVRGLTPADLEAIADLEARVVAHDGGRLKLEWGRLRDLGRGRGGVGRGGGAEDVLARSDDGRLVGFAGLYGYGSNAVEIAGMVEPESRRHGLGGALLDAAVQLCPQAGGGSPLLIVARESAGGRALAHARGAVLDHSEHALVLDGDPADGLGDPGPSMRPATPADVPAIVAILSAGFGYVPDDVAERLSGADGRTLVTELTVDGRTEIVATMRAQLTETTGGIYGFTVDPAHQGRGIGRDFLRRACRQLRDQGATQVGLEVAVENDRALGLYTSLGFTPVVTEDYWRLPV